MSAPGREPLPGSVPGLGHERVDDRLGGVPRSSARRAAWWTLPGRAGSGGAVRWSSATGRTGASAGTKSAEFEEGRNRGIRGRSLPSPRGDHVGIPTSTLGSEGASPLKRGRRTPRGSPGSGRGSRAGNGPVNDAAGGGFEKGTLRIGRPGRRNGDSGAACSACPRTPLRPRRARTRNRPSSRMIGTS